MFQYGWRGVSLLGGYGAGLRIVAGGIASAAFVLLAAGLADTAVEPARAQGKAQDFRISIAPIVQMTTSTENPLRLEILPRAAVPERALLLIKGLPQSVALSQGRLFESGVWAVPVAHIGDLRVAASSSTVPRTDFSISLVTVAGDVLAVSNSSLVVAGPGQALQATAAIQQADQIPATGRDITEPAITLRPPPPTGEALERIMLCMQKGEAGLKSGNITVARAFFTQAADAGWAEGALALGATYDPVELENMRMLGGIQPDPDMARRWYETAVRLGSRTAETRLQRLSER